MIDGHEVHDALRPVEVVDDDGSLELLVDELAGLSVEIRLVEFGEGDAPSRQFLCQKDIGLDVGGIAESRDVVLLADEFHVGVHHVGEDDGHPLHDFQPCHEGGVGGFVADGDEEAERFLLVGLRDDGAAPLYLLLFVPLLTAEEGDGEVGIDVYPAEGLLYCFGEAGETVSEVTLREKHQHVGPLPGLPGLLPPAGVHNDQCHRSQKGCGGKDCFSVSDKRFSNHGQLK